MKKLFIIIGVFLLIIGFVEWGTKNGTGGNGIGQISIISGNEIVLTDDAPVCTSKENVKKMTSFVARGNKNGRDEMLSRGEALLLSKGTKVNIIKNGSIVEIETASGSRYFAPREAIK